MKVSTPISEVIEIMNEKLVENGVWIVNEHNKPLDLLHCTDVIRFLLLKENKQKEREGADALGGSHIAAASPKKGLLVLNSTASPYAHSCR